jgi:hypothetical protein
MMRTLVFVTLMLWLALATGAGLMLPLVSR